MSLIQQFQQSSTGTKAAVIALLLGFAGILVCSCALVAGFFLMADQPQSDIAGPTPVVSTPIPSEPIAVPTPVEFAGWRGEYFSNSELQGEPVLVRDDQEINFQWGNNPPAPGMPAENYSMRWTISREAPAGIYRFTGTFDNGVRLWIDDNLIVDKWVAAPVSTDSVDVNLAAGSHTVRLEYFHASGPAVAQLRVDYLDNFPDWKAEYYAQPDFNSPPVVVRNEQEISHNWGATSPIPGSVPDNNYAVRWTRGLDLVDGNYIFRAEVEGGVRVYLNNQIIIDSWGESALRQVDAVAAISRGRHGLKVEHWKQSGNGQIRFGWAKLEDPGQPPIAVINGASSAVIGQSVSFNARSSAVADGSQLVAFEWDLGDGTGASGTDVTHVYNSAGVFAVTLTVVDDKGLSNATVHQIQIVDQPATPQPGQPPYPVIAGPSKAKVGDIVTFDASQTTSTNPIVRNAWEFGDGTRVDNSVQVQHAYASPATYRVKLTVEDNQGLKAVTYHQITIRGNDVQPTPPPDQPPAAKIEAPSVVELGQAFTVSAANSKCATACVSYAWDMGDGTQANAVTLQHNYQSPGQFNVILIVTDDKGLEGTVNQPIQVVEAGVPPEPTLPPVPTEEPPEPEKPIEPSPEPEQPVEPSPEAEQPIEPPPEATEDPQQEQQEGTTEGDGN